MILCGLVLYEVVLYDVVLCGVVLYWMIFDDVCNNNNNNNNNNNYKTCNIEPTSSKRIELNRAPSTGVGQTHSPGTMRSLSINGQMGWKLRKDKQV